MMGQPISIKLIAPLARLGIQELSSHTSIISKQPCLIRPLENFSIGYCVFCFQLFNTKDWNQVSGFAKICKKPKIKR